MRIEKDPVTVRVVEWCCRGEEENIAVIVDSIYPACGHQELLHHPIIDWAQLSVLGLGLFWQRDNLTWPQKEENM